MGSGKISRLDKQKLDTTTYILMKTRLYTFVMLHDFPGENVQKSLSMKDTKVKLISG